MKRWIGLLCLFSLYSCGQTQSISTPASDAEAVHFSVLTFNVAARPGRGDKELERVLPLIGQKLDAFEISGVQECLSKCELLLNASKAPYKSYFKDKIGGIFPTNSGLASLSKYPIIEVKKRYYLAQAELSDQIAIKAILLIRYNIAGHTVDVYNTNMQPGDSQHAQTARTLQAAELIQMVLTESPPTNAVIIHGDFNMGPKRPGKTWSKYDPQHYNSQADMLARTTVFSGIMQSLALRDASDFVFGPKLDHIDRILFRSGSNTVFKPVGWDDKSDVFVDAEGHPLSDNTPVAVRFEMQE